MALRGPFYCISWDRHLQLRKWPASRQHFALHGRGSLPFTTKLHVLSQRTVFFLGTATGMFDSSAIFGVSLIRTTRETQNHSIRSFAHRRWRPHSPSAQKKVMHWRLSCDETLHSSGSGLFEGVGSNPPQKPQPIFADF